MKLAILIALLIMVPAKESIYQFSIQKLNSSDELRLSDFEGKKLLIVNVASKCGYTPQYNDLQKFSEYYKDKVVVIGFPCNQFGGQEPGSEENVQEFCSKTYGVEFPMTTKVEVKGENQHPIYQWLTQKSKNGKGDFEVSWNFNKFLIDENGKLIAHFSSGVNPFDDEITDYID